MTYEEDNGVLRRYLLGSPAHGERELVEQDLLGDESLYEELLATEDELIDEYVWGRLPESERASFLQYLRGLPDHKQKLAFAETLRSRSLALPVRDIAQPRHEGASYLQVPVWLAAAAALLIVLGGILFFVTIEELREEHGRTQAELGQLSGAPATDVSSTPVVRSYLLAAGTLRSGGARQVVPIRSQPELLELRLDLGSIDFDRYRAVVHDANALELMSLAQLTARNQEDRILVVFSVSSDLFTPGDYYISLMGDVESGEPEPVARYDFRISAE